MVSYVFSTPSQMMAALPSPRSSSRDLRDGGRWTLAQTLKNQLLYVGASALLIGLAPLAFLPPSWIRGLGRALGRVLHLVRLGRGTAEENLERVFLEMPPPERDALCRRVYLELGAHLGDTLVLLARPGRCIPIPFEEGSREVLEQALAKGRGVIFASAHLGPWERVAGSLVKHGFSLTTVARESYDPRFMRIYERIRRGQGVKVVYRGASSSGRKMVRTLRQGGVLGLPMDLCSRVPSIRAPFLGIPAMTPVGPARLAIRTGAPVVVGTAIRDGGGLLLRVTAIATPEDGGDAGEADLTRRLNDELSARILEFKEGWVWMHPRWAPIEPFLEKTASQPGETRYTSLVR
jgi:KDO2-lipid IV(A) lauroyltransferase